MNGMKLVPIGKIENKEGSFRVVLDPRYAAGLKGLDGCGHVQILWWADACDNETARRRLVETKPYKNGPAELGVFATRSPERPNPVAVSTAGILRVAADAGTIELDYLDAFDGTPVLDLKPYVPSLDRVERPVTPSWCRHWPRSREESGDFDWAAEFNF